MGDLPIIGSHPHRRWLLLLDAIVLALVLLILVVEDAGQLFKLIFFVLTIGTFFWDLKTFVVRGAFWVSLTTVILIGSIWAGRVPILELFDIPFFLAVLVLVFTISKSRTEGQDEIANLLAEEQERSKRLSDLAELKADFTAMVVHEFGNPISALRRLNEMLRFDSLDGEVKEYVLDSIRGELGTLDTLVADVQSAVAIEREDFHLETRPVPLGGLLQESEQYGRSVSGERAFTLETDSFLKGREVEADPERIAQVLRNLISNAVKYSPAGSPIELRAKPGEAGKVRIEVADEGRGIGPEDLDRVFEKFSRGRGSGNGEVIGVGLGLYISQRLVQAHGTDLTVSSESGKGSIFGFELRPSEKGAEKE
ncbi:MAG: HAMP domain-containing sensor histidine kinase [Rubrobacteraceae bacterium]